MWRATKWQTTAESYIASAPEAAGGSEEAAFLCPPLYAPHALPQKRQQISYCWQLQPFSASMFSIQKERGYLSHAVWNSQMQKTEQVVFKKLDFLV